MVLDTVSPTDNATIQDSITKAISKAEKDGIILTDSQKKLVTQAITDGASITDALATVSSITPLAPLPFQGSDQQTLAADLITDLKVINSTGYIDLSLIDNRNYVKSLIEIYNEDAVNTMVFSIYGNNNDNDGLAPAFDNSWLVLPNAKDVSLVALTPIAFALTDRWRWILIRGKATSVVTSYKLMVTASKH